MVRGQAVNLLVASSILVTHPNSLKGPMAIAAGTRVRLSAAFKAFVAAQQPAPFETREEYEQTSWPAHLKEFDGCEGVVLGHPVDDWPEWDVRWEPSGLRYSYRAEDLEEVLQ